MAGLSGRYKARLNSALKRGKDSFTVTRKGKTSSKITGDTVSRIVGDEQTQLIVAANNTRQIQSAINQAIATALEEIGLSAERFAKAETPVDTGRLRNSITHALDMGENAVYIGTNVEYAPAVEMTVFVRGKMREGAHMLEHAAANHGDYYRGILKKHMQGN